MRFVSLSVEYIEDTKIPQIAWKVAARFDLPTMYDAAFLAVSERLMEDSQSTVEFWTADRELVVHLGEPRPEYVNLVE